jgi:predicted nucleotidyltransferase
MGGLGRTIRGFIPTSDERQVCMPDSRSKNETKSSATSSKAVPVEFRALHDPRFPVHGVAAWLEPYLRILVERVHPEKIILFGSYAYGNPTKDSDFDLLIVRRDIISEKQSNLEIRAAFDGVDAPPASFTLLSKTPEQVREKLAQNSPIFREILGNGLEIYAAAAH